MSYFEKFAVVILVVFFSYLVAVPPILSYFIDIDKYIDESQVIELKPYEYVDYRGDVLLEYYSSNYIINNEQNYYQISYYTKNKKDHSRVSLNTGDKPRNVIIKVNPTELKRHRGTIHDPIPVFNFAFEPDEYVWDDESYRYNIKNNFIYNDVLHARSYSMFTYIMLGISMLLLIMLMFLEMNRKAIRMKELRENNAKGK